MLSLSGVTKRFGEKVAVDSVDLDLLPRERFCLMGPNGAGKTTVMRMVVGMARPTRGSIGFLGRDPSEAPLVRRRLGYLSDKPYVYDKLTAREHLRLHAALYDLPTQEVTARGTQLLDELEMGSTLDGRVETFSYGMQKKLALTLALAHEPDLLVLDEPLNGLDPDSAGKMEDLLRRYAAEGRAIMLSTHAVEFAARFASRVGVMREGRLTLHDPPDDEEADAGWVRDLLTREKTRTEDGERLNGGRA